MKTNLSLKNTLYTWSNTSILRLPYFSSIISLSISSQPVIGIQRWWGLTSHKTYQDRQTDLIGKDDSILLLLCHYLDNHISPSQISHVLEIVQLLSRLPDEGWKGNLLSSKSLGTAEPFYSEYWLPDTMAIIQTLPFQSI